MTEAIGIDDVQAARARLAGHARVTPLLESPFLNALAGRRLLVKAECLQRTGSFKFRGAWSALTGLAPAVRAQGVLAYSSGNHAQGIAHAAQLLQVPAVIVMPHDAPDLKLRNTRAYGAEVVTYDRPGGEVREEIGARLATERGLTLIKPYDDPLVIAGQGTCGLEIAEQAQLAGVDQADVLVCCGGGGFSAGIAVALAAQAPGFRVRPVEPVGFDDVARSLDRGERCFNDRLSGSIADAILTPAPGELTWPILQRLCGPGLTVTDDESLVAMAQAFLHLKLVAEPGGAVALAAALSRTEQIDGEAVVVTLSGGNTDAETFATALATLR